MIADRPRRERLLLLYRKVLQFHSTVVQTAKKVVGIVGAFFPFIFLYKFAMLESAAALGES